MKIEDFLSPASVTVDVRAPDKAHLLRELAVGAAAQLGIGASRIADELAKREALGSTGLGGGIAVPHARLSELDAPFGALARLRRPIDFEAIDGQPVDLVFLLLLPEAARGDLNALAAVARKLRDPESLQRLRSAEDSAALYRELTR